MFETIFAALLPIVVTLMLGYYAAWHHDFSADQGSILNKMVMLYALPLTLFAGMAGMDRDSILAQKDAALLIFISMALGYLLVLLIAKYIFKRDTGTAALQALAIAGPAVPFVGVPVLGFLYGDMSVVSIAVCSLIMNLVQVPITLFLLSNSRDASSGNSVSVLNNLKNTLKEPVVWAPILAFLIMIIDIKIPAPIISSIKLLGGATGGVALFASGVILFSYTVTLNKAVICSVFSKNIVIPILVLMLGRLFGIDEKSLSISVIAMAIPTASICVILAVQYKTAAKEMSSTLFFSTIFSVVTMGALLYYMH
jgi:malonate transporter